MADQLVQLSDTTNVTGESLVSEDYNKHPAICRFGIWVGTLVTFTETVTLAYEHTEDPWYVGWAINGTTVIDPGYGSPAPPSGAPCPGAPSITYRCPLNGVFDRISLTSASGDPHECVSLQVLYRGPHDQNNPARYGPFARVCLAGSEIEWPAFLLSEWEACLHGFWKVIRSYVQIAHVNPGDPVEFLAGFPVEEALILKGEIEILERLNVESQPALAKAIEADVIGRLRARMPGGRVFGRPAMPRKQR